MTRVRIYCRPCETMKFSNVGQVRLNHLKLPRICVLCANILLQTFSKSSTIIKHQIRLMDNKTISWRVALPVKPNVGNLISAVNLSDCPLSIQMCFTGPYQFDLFFVLTIILACSYYILHTMLCSFVIYYGQCFLYIQFVCQGHKMKLNCSNH